MSGRIDLGIVAYPGRRPQIAVIPFREDRLVLVCAAHHPFARRRTIAIKDLEGQTFVGYERDIPTRRATDRLLSRKGVTVRYVMELDNIETDQARRRDRRRRGARSRSRRSSRRSRIGRSPPSS